MHAEIGQNVLEMCLDTKVFPFIFFYQIVQAEQSNEQTATE